MKAKKIISIVYKVLLLTMSWCDMCDSIRIAPAAPADGPHKMEQWAAKVKVQSTTLTHVLYSDVYTYVCIRY